MAGEVLVNMSDVISSLPSYIFERFDNLVLILQAVGIAFIVYIIYIIIKTILDFRNVKRLKVLVKKVDSLERKIDILIGDKKDKDKGKKKKKK